MNKQQLIAYLKNPGQINPDVIPQLKELLKAYPYFQTGHVLLLKSLYNAKDVMYENYLTKIAAYAGNRELLYDYILNKQAVIIDEPNAQPTSVSPETNPKTVKPQESPPQPEYFDAVTVSNDYFKLTNQPNTANSDAFEGVHSFAHWLEMMSNKKENTQELKPVKKDKKWALIDNFISEKPAIRTSMSDAPGMQEEINDLTEKSAVETEEFMTETLARIYIKQKNYTKALQIFKKLSLKYPEKSIYFAGQIKIIEQLKNNEK